MEKEDVLLGDALCAAAKDGDIPEVERILGKGIGVNFNDQKGCTPLYVACRYRQTAMARYLIEQGADVDALNHNGNTPLHVAASAQSADIVDLLLAAGANPDIKNNHGEAARERIDTYRLVTDAERAEEARQEEQARLYKELREAAVAGNLEAVVALVDAGADINAKPETYSNNVLQLVCGQRYEIDGRDGDKKKAIYAGQLSVVRFLIDRGADVNAKNDFNTMAFWWCGSGDEVTALHLAALMGRLEEARLLIEAGADVNAKTTDRYAPLHYAKTVDVATYLLSVGAELDAITDDRNTPLRIAVGSGRDDLAFYLLKQGAKADVGPLLCYAASNLNLDLMKALIEAGADPRARLDSLTPLESIFNGLSYGYGYEEEAKAAVMLYEAMGLDIAKDCGAMDQVLIDFFMPETPAYNYIRALIAERVLGEISSVLDDLTEADAPAAAPRRRGLAL